MRRLQMRRFRGWLRKSLSFRTHVRHGTLETIQPLPFTPDEVAALIRSGSPGMKRLAAGLALKAGRQACD